MLMTHHHDAPFQEDEDHGDNEDHDAYPQDGEYLFAETSCSLCYAVSST
jgi:hypothetical protein